MAEGAKACPKGHSLDSGGRGKVDDDGEASTIGVDLSNANAETAPVVSPSRPSTLFECDPCGRLVEMQEHRGQVVIPSFCPWCGRLVEPIVGREIDGYEVGDLLAQGGFGLVYLASNVAEPKMKAVIKFLRPRMGYLQPALIRVFVEEARLTEEIGQTCWNVVRVSNVRERPWPYFFMEYIRGTTLDQVLRTAKDKRIPIEDAKGYLRGIAKALAATHAHGRVHRDLKPLNIMVIQSQDIRAEERIKLVDFGLSMKIARGRTSFEGATSTFDDGTAAGHSPVQSAGTPEYMPPEAFDGLNEFAGDIYSFGVTAYEILTGETPWTQPPDGSQRFFYWRDAHKKAPPRPIREVRPDVPGWLAAVVMKCLAKDPKDRIRTADELISSLREPMPRWLWAAAGAAVLLFGVLLWFALRGGVVRDGAWSDHRGEARGKELRLWVSEPADLAGMKATLRASDGEILSATPSSPHVLCKVEQGIVQVGFREGPGLASLIDSPVAIDGRGSGFRAEGTLRVGRDITPPVLGEPGIVILETSQSPPEVLALPPVKRFHSQKVALAVSVEEEHLHEIHLKFHDFHDRTLPDPVRGVHAGKGVWTFPLTGLRGDYKGMIQAVDAAGHDEETDFVDFLVDDGPDLNYSKDPIIAAGRAFYEIEVVEPLARVEVRGKGVKGSAIHDIEARSALEIRRTISDSPEVKPHKIMMRPYLLAVALDGTAQGPFDLIVTDTATPPNTNEAEPWKLDFKAPDPLDAKVDITGISVEFEDEDGEPLSLEAFPPNFTFPAATRFTRVNRLRTDFRKRRIHDMSVALGGKAVPGAVRVDDTLAELDRLDLAGSRDVAFTENKLLLTFLDPLDRALEVPLSLRTDRQQPRITFRAMSGGRSPEDHRVDSWKDVDLLIESNEPLSWAACRIQGRDLDGVLDAQSEKRVARFKGEDLEYFEGSHPVKVNACDLAGNPVANPDCGEIHLNLGPPRILPIAEESSPRVFDLTGNELSFEVTDGNQPLLYEDVTFEVDEERHVVKIVPPDVKGSRITHKVSLTGLPANVSRGRLTIRIADRFGLRSDLPYEGHEPASWIFNYKKPRPSWQPLVSWRRMEWVYIQTPDPKDEYYISRTEVPIEVYAVFVGRKVVRPPKHWGNGGKWPTFSTKDEEPLDERRVGRLPVVGIRPEDAEVVAARGFQGRLPVLQKEWRFAAWKENNGEQYPWKDGETGRDYANCFDAWDRSAVYENHHSGTINVTGVFRAFEVDFDPWEHCPASLKERLNYPGKIYLLHLIGNVGELVRMEDGSYGIAGGDFSDNYESINLLREGGRMKPFEEEDAKTGFRIVIPLENAHPEFKEKARKAGRE